MEKIKSLNSNAIYRLMPAMMKILVTDFTYAKLGYKYKEIYNVFVGKEML